MLIVGAAAAVGRRRWTKEDPQMKKSLLGILLTFLLLGSFAVAADGDRILGLWNTAEEDCKIEIFKCGNIYCGRIAWLKEPLYPAGDGMGMAGRPIVDRQNPSPDLRSRPLVGLQLMEGFIYTGKNVWERGTIYNPETGKTYKCKMTLTAPDHLEVRGFIGISLLGGTSIWTR